jgi:hypothetical protein
MPETVDFIATRLASPLAPIQIKSAMKTKNGLLKRPTKPNIRAAP